MSPNPEIEIRLTHDQKYFLLSKLGNIIDI